MHFGVLFGVDEHVVQVTLVVGHRPVALVEQRVH